MSKKSSKAKPKRLPGVGSSRIVSRRTSKCDCNLCKRNRRYYRNTSKLPKAERDWMRGFYDSVLDSECEAEMQKAANDQAQRPAT